MLMEPVSPFTKPRNAFELEMHPNKSSFMSTQLMLPSQVSSASEITGVGGFRSSLCAKDSGS